MQRIVKLMRDLFGNKGLVRGIGYGLPVLQFDLSLNSLHVLGCFESIPLELALLCLKACAVRSYLFRGIGIVLYALRHHTIC
jgi:hypothetical protein